MTPSTTTAIGGFVDRGLGASEFRDAAIEGLSQPQKRLPCKFLYDERGSTLFDRITEVKEYYPARTEIALLERYRCEIAERIGPDATFVDLGSGSSRKIDVLLGALQRPAAYVPVDISRDYLLSAAERVAAAYPDLPVFPVCADYTEPFSLPEQAPTGRPVAFFPGSTIGNFRPQEAERFLQRVGRLVGSHGALILGVDLDKDPAILHAAYNDSSGVTAAFNLNLLTRLNRELGATFDLDRFAHSAVYNRQRGCVEMHLVSRCTQRVKVAGMTFSFREGESIHTEDSHKYRLEQLEAMSARAGWQRRRLWIDDDGLFSVQLLQRATGQPGFGP